MNDDNHALRTFQAARTHRRKVLKAALCGSAAAAIGLRAPAVLGQSKPFAGVTINGASFQHVFHTYLKEYIPEFEEQTGMTVNFELQAFPIYNQRMDLELSTGGSAYDFCNVTFIYTGRWIGAGWVEPLDPTSSTTPISRRTTGTPMISSAARRAPCRTPTATPTASPGRRAP